MGYGTATRIARREKTTGFRSCWMACLLLLLDGVERYL